MENNLDEFAQNYIRDVYAGTPMLGNTKSHHVINESAITPNKSKFLQTLITSNTGISRTIEIGCAMGLSSLSICNSTKTRVNPHHIIIDPFQTKDWDGVGVLNLKKIGVDFFTIIEKGSEFALPNLAEKEDNSIDLAFIDGWHTFDHTLIDAFYLMRMLRVGGFLIIDDYEWPAIRRVVDYLETLPCLIRMDGAKRGVVKNDLLRVKFIFFVGRFNPFLRIKQVRTFLKKRLNQRLSFLLSPQDYETMVCFQKISNDNRNYDFHRKF